MAQAVDGKGMRGVNDALQRAAWRGEVLAGQLRLAIAGLALLQFLAFREFAGILSGDARATLILGNLVLIIGLSLWVLKRLQSRDPSRNLLIFSVAIDCMAVVSVTAPTAIWPDQGYDGMLDLPHMFFFALAVIVSGIRLNPRLPLVSFVFNSLGLATVLSIDAKNDLLWGGYGVQELVLLIIVMLSALLLAVSVARRSLRLAYEAGVAASEQANARRQLGVYVPEEVVELAMAKGALGLDGARKDVAVLFVDLRDFTSLCDGKDPEEIVVELNSWLHEVVEVVQEEKGTVDKYIGDCVMAVFGMVQTEGHEASRCVRTAARIVTRMRRFNAERMAQGKAEMTYGIGCHYGPGVVGSMGGSGRLQYTVIGDVVNRASRLEAATKNSSVSVLISRETWERAQIEGSVVELPEVLEHDPVTLKGIEGEVEVVALG